MGVRTKLERAQYDEPFKNYERSKSRVGSARRAAPSNIASAMPAIETARARLLQTPTDRTSPRLCWDVQSTIHFALGVQKDYTIRTNVLGGFRSGGATANTVHCAYNQPGCGMGTATAAFEGDTFAARQ